MKVLVKFANRKYIASLIIEYQKITYVVLKPLFSTPIFLVLPSNAAITKEPKNFANFAKTKNVFVIMLYTRA